MRGAVKETSTLKTIGEGVATSGKLKNKLNLYKKLIRTHETTGVWLVFWPTAWSMMLAAKDTSIPPLYLVCHLCLMLVLSFIVLSISCIYNDLMDRDFDREVERCKDRPLASGAVSTGEALALLIPFGLVFILFLMQMNGTGKTVLLASLGLLFVYPFAKRFTNYPAVVLGLASNNGVFLGWILVRGGVDWSVCVPLLSGAFFWTIVYDTLYGLQDAEDDARIGVKSMALSFGSGVRLLAATASALATLCFAATGAAAGLAWPYYVALAAVLVHLLTQVFTVDIDDPKDCGSKYRSNQRLALVLFLGIVAGNWLHLGPWQEGISKMQSADL